MSALQPPRIGTHVTVNGLVGRPELNGQSGEVISGDSQKSRAGVRLHSGEKVNVKPANLDQGAEDGKKQSSTDGRKEPLSTGSGNAMWASDTVELVTCDLPHGRHLVAKRDLDVGALVIQEQPLMVTRPCTKDNLCVECARGFCNASADVQAAVLDLCSTISVPVDSSLYRDSIQATRRA